MSKEIHVVIVYHDGSSDLAETLELFLSRE